MRSSATYIRNFIFGVEDSLVSTVGLLTGVAIAGVPRDIIILTGVVLIIVEALSMAAGSFLAEASTEEVKKRAGVSQRSVGGGAIMFVSYLFAGFVPLAPYFFATGMVALKLSVVASLAALFVLGVMGGSLAGGYLVKRGLRIMLVGGIAIAAGVGAAVLLAHYGVAA